MKKISPPLFGLALLQMAIGAAYAQGTSAPKSLEKIVVTGSPIIESSRIDAFGSLTTEVGASQVRDLNALDLSSALRRTPGVIVSRFNPVGSFGGDEGGAVYVRGLGASRPASAWARTPTWSSPSARWR